MSWIRIDEAGEHIGEEVTLKGWLYNLRSSGSIHFLQIRDGSGLMQAVVQKNVLGPEEFARCGRLPQESSLVVAGELHADPRAAGGYEMTVSKVELVREAEPDYPVTRKEHGPDFLLDHRHLWIRAPRQAAILRVRNEVLRAIHDFLGDRGFVQTDAPILTPAACEGTTTLFETDYFEWKAYLSQSGQLYNEAAALALGRVYCLGPTFRAEKSKTRRHLTEFWMLEPEMAYCDQEMNMQLQEELVAHVVQRVLTRRTAELKIVGRDTAPLEKIQMPFPRLSYDRAIAILKEKGVATEWGNDFGGADETMLGDLHDRPVFITNYPAKVKAFYMQPDPDRPETALCADLIAPEGYGEIIGGSQRIDDPELLRRRLAEHNLPLEAYQWYLDLRRFGSVPHAGFGLGIERTVAWICGLEHLREAIPFPRMLNRIYP